MRINQKDLEIRVERLNQLAGFEGKQEYSTIGSYVLDYAYGGVALHQYTNEHGGIRDIFGGHDTKKELYYKMHAYEMGATTIWNG